MKYVQAQKYLNSFVNYEKQVSFSYEDLGLARVRDLFALLDIDYSCLKYIHIAGTKGKGSTAQFCASILAQSNYKVGLYTSPHILDFRERIKILNKKKEALITPVNLARIVTGFKEKLASSNDKNYTFFEITTALAIAYFIEKKVDYVVLECGLGGRLDATNIVEPLVSVLTPIDFDHQHILGKTLSAIAREKSGIIKKNRVVVSSRQEPEAIAEIETACRENDARLYLEGRDFFVSNVVCMNSVTKFDFSLRNMTLRGLKISLKGEHQAGNAALACAALASLDKPLDFKSGLKKAKLFGRFSVVGKKLLMVLDVAHNEVSFKKLSQNLKLYFKNKKVILIFACAKDKDVRAMLNAYTWHKLFLPGIDNERLFVPGEIKTVDGFKNAVVFSSVAKAVSVAKKMCKKDCMIVVAGSFFLAGEFMRTLKNKV